MVQLNNKAASRTIIYPGCTHCSAVGLLWPASLTSIPFIVIKNISDA